MNAITEWSARLYRRIWALLVGWLRVPDEPPTLPVRPGETLEQFRPAPGFLKYLKFWFWLGLLPLDILILIGWIAITVAMPLLGVFLAPVALVLAVAPDIVVYIALHVRYDTTWYVMTPRSIRIRRGVWIIQEVTLTFENVQNVTIQQGPLQRYYGIANLVLETAGGGGGGAGEHGGSAAGHQGMIEGISDAAGLRDRIVARLRQSRDAGLGDEQRNAPTAPAPSAAWTSAHLAVLREIRGTLAAMSGP